MLVLFSIFISLLLSVKAEDSNITNEIINFNMSSEIYLPSKKLYIYQLITPPEFIKDLNDYKNLFRGNIQGKCSEYYKYIKLPVKCKHVMNFLNLRGKNWRKIPYNYNFDPYSKVYGINKYKNFEEYGDTYDEILTFSRDKDEDDSKHAYLGEYIDIIDNHRFEISLSEAGVLPKDTQFWWGDGCRNWVKGNKKWRGQTGYSDYQLNFLRETEAICTKEYHATCLCIT